jgi:transposase
MRDIVEIYEHWQARQSLTTVARSLKVDRKTVRKYVKVAMEAGITRERVLTREQWMAFVRERFPEVAGGPSRTPWRAKLEPYAARIREGLASNRMVTVWQRLKQDTGLDISVATFRRYVHAVMPEAIPRATVTVWRPEVAPGEEAQLDFGRMGYWHDPIACKRIKVWAFIMVLAYSRHMFVRLVTSLDALTWLECHVVGFEFLEGVPRRLVLDNLTDAVVKADLYDPQFNRAYDELAAHYHVLIDPCRVGHPKDKGYVAYCTS